MMAESRNGRKAVSALPFSSFPALERALCIVAAALMLSTLVVVPDAGSSASPAGPPAPLTVIAGKTLTRGEPVVVLGSQLPSYVTAMRDVDNIFVWAYRNGGWRQVVFQIDEANGTFLNRAGSSAGPHKQFYIPDNGWLDNDDEIAFMSNETGDRVNAPIWAPGASTTVQRYEITVTDPLDTTKKGWVYIFYHDTPPAWTTVDYASWSESANTVSTYGYTLDYLDSETRQLAFMSMQVKPSIGGTNADMVDREKKLVRLEVSIDPERCEYGTSTRGLETYYPGVLDDDPLYLNEYGVKDGRVRVLKHIRWGFGSANLFDTSDKMGWRGQVEYKYYSRMFFEDEIVSDNSNGAVTRTFYRSVDHSASAGSMSYYNSLGATATVNGVSGDDSVPSGLMTWGQVSSSRGSYVTRFKPGAFSGAPVDIQITTRWIDDSAATDNDGTRTGAEAGRYGEHGIRWYAPTDDTAWNYMRGYYYTYFLPAGSPNVGATYAAYADSPVVTNNPSPVLQTYVADRFPPVTVAGTVLVNGVASLTVPVSTAGIVTLAATISDATTGNANVASAVWTDGYAAFPGTAMTATDGSFSSPTEGVRATLNLATWSTGTHQIHVYGTDAYLNKNETSVQHATVTIVDDMPPATTAGSVRIDGAATHTTLFSEAAPVTLTATVTDVGRGNSNVISAVYTRSFAAFPGTAMSSSDGAYDEPTEAIQATLDLPTWNAGTYLLHPYGTDAVPLQNTVSTEHATLTIIDDVAPAVSQPLLDGLPLRKIGLSDDPHVTLSATVDDAGLGGTTVGGANFTLGAMNWPTSTALTPATPLDTATEPFSHALDVTGWFPGTYVFHVYGWDGVPNCDEAGAPYAVLIIENDYAPEVREVTVDDVASVSVPFSARGPVTLNATLDDTGHGDNVIAGANWTLGMAAWGTGGPLQPVDALDTCVESFSSEVDVSGWPVGVHDLYVYGWDETNDRNVTSLAYASVAIYDDVAPSVSEVRINGAATFETDNVAAGVVTLTARVVDSATGASDIGGANCTVGSGAWATSAPMAPQTALDSPDERFTATVDVSSWAAGVYRLYAYGWDAVPNGNSSSISYATLIIHDVLAPAVRTVRLDGASIVEVGFENATAVELTGLLDDTGRGGSAIVAANYTVGYRNWASAVPMQTYDDEALADVPVTGVVTSDDFTAPDDFRNVAKLPDDGRQEHVTEATTVTNTAYTYATGTGTNKWAYYQDSNDAPATSINTQTVLTGTQYTQVGDSDDSRYTSNDPGSGDYVSVYCVLYLGQAPSTVTQVSLSWEGRVSRAGNVNLYARDQSAGSWTLVASGAAGTSSDGTVSGTLSGVTWSNYVTGANNQFIFLVQYMVADAVLQTTTMTTDFIGANVQSTVIALEHRWLFDMGSGPTFWVDASNPAGSDSSFKFQWSADGAAWSDFATAIQYAPGDTGVLKSSAVALAAYDDSFYVRAVSVNPGPVADTLSVDRMWATGQFNNNPEAVRATIDVSAWKPGEYQLFIYGRDASGQRNLTSTAHATLVIGDDMAPRIRDLLAGGASYAVVDLSSGTAALEGVVDDTLTGGSNANRAWVTEGEANWNASRELAPVGLLDSAYEEYSLTLSLATLSHGPHEFFMYGSDAMGNTNTTSQEAATLFVNDDVPPLTANWTTLVNGAQQAWVRKTVTDFVVLTARITDAMRGFSDVVSANFTVGARNWTAGALTPSDGAWDECDENATVVVDISRWPIGTHRIYVYGVDAQGNARTDTATYAVLNIDGLGPAIGLVSADGANPYKFATDSSFLLKAYGDDRARGNNKVIAAEYFVDGIGANGTGVAMANTGFAWDSAYEGAKATIYCSAWTVGEFHTYYIHFKDDTGMWGDWGSVLVMRKASFGIPFVSGWNLISVPLYRGHGLALSDMLANEWSNIEAVQHYNATQGRWLVYHRAMPGWANSLRTCEVGWGLWVKFTAAGDGLLTVEGGLPSPATVKLRAGWNLVGYTSLTSMAASEALAGTSYDGLQRFNAASPYMLADMAPSELMAPGKGYWVHVPGEVVWTLP